LILNFGGFVMTAPIRAALYLRISTGRSIPDQRRQAKGYCTSSGWEIVADYVEPGASATDDRRPEFQRMIDAATAKPPMFDVIVVHSFSRFFRDQFQLEFYVRRLAKNGVRLNLDHPLARRRSHEQHDPPDHGAVRRAPVQGERQAHLATENARQGFWNGALPLIGYRIVAGEQRGHRTKRTWRSIPSRPRPYG
jgi:site-specific DNA recombinase